MAEATTRRARGKSPSLAAETRSGAALIPVPARRPERHRRRVYQAGRARRYGNVQRRAGGVGHKEKADKERSEHRYAAIELRGIGPQIGLWKVPELSPARIAGTQRQLADSGLRVVCLGSSANMHEPDAAKRAADLDEARRRPGQRMGENESGLR